MLKCPRCMEQQRIGKKGFFIRASDQKHIQRYRCGNCHKQFSSQLWAIDYRFRKRWLDQMIFRLLAKGMSERACAFILHVKPEAIARRLVRFGAISEQHLHHYRQARPPVTKVMIDELETFEHTKCKPLTVPIAVEASTRKILSLEVGAIAAKGKLAAMARQKYGKRLCQRRKVLDQVFQELSPWDGDGLSVRSDESPHYPAMVRKHLPRATHLTVKGRRGCVVGQGELKRGGWDPLFSLNHTYAMFRDNIKRLTRRTWCTSKRQDRLRALLFIYAYLHNERLDHPGKIFLRASPRPN